MDKRLNQDVLENFFRVIPCKSALHDHPNSLESIFRVDIVRLYINDGIQLLRQTIFYQDCFNYKINIFGYK